MTAENKIINSEELKFTPTDLFALTILLVASVLCYIIAPSIEIVSGLKDSFFVDHKLATLIAFMVLSVLLIIFVKPTTFEKKLDRVGIPGKEAFIPVIALLVSCSLNLVTQETIKEIFFLK